MPEFPSAKIVRVSTQQLPDIDASMYLEEMRISEETREIIRKGWPWYAVELGPGVRTVTAQMLDERTDEELLQIPGMTKYRLREVRKAYADDPGVARNLYGLSREEVMPALRGAFPEHVEQRFGPDGRPLPEDPEEESSSVQRLDDAPPRRLEDELPQPGDQKASKAAAEGHYHIPTPTGDRILCAECQEDLGPWLAESGSA